MRLACSILLQVRYNRFMRPVVLVAAVVACLLCGCQKDTPTQSLSDDPPAKTASGAATPDVGAVTPAHTVTIDEAAGGGVNSAALRKAKNLSSEGVGSVNSAQKQGYGAGDDSGN